ncbi:MAG: hypothetical protein II937_09505 [Bacteroidales bacterium]|nr:hypothetical protein [Bacteroidales bacterium]
MGEYAKLRRTGKTVKLGTCECMYYCTIKQRHQVTGYKFQRGCLTLWRLPLVPEFGSEKDKYGNYKVEKEATKAGDGNPDDWKYYNATKINAEAFWENVKQTCPESLDANGTFQISHPSGLLMSVPCYHGQKLPEAPKGWSVGWNGLVTNQMRIHWIKTKGDEVSIIVSCQYCGKSWEVSIEELEEMMKFPCDFVVNKELPDWDKRKYERRYVFVPGGEELFNAIKEEITDWMADSPKTDTIKFNPKSK